ncbi:hypothetical protein H109_01821 [Trichophyton interdigitale MR816]|uniref:Protein kinase domain-containing protein n=1 Tax=Trichophyton interdigitale (strain MR816) TaxID=1215338 RepID=A0A059JFB1_TRIIM|nr:hypothetical protein H109_01821 [Trichophyton interdigitale MR816]
MRYAKSARWGCFMRKISTASRLQQHNWTKPKAQAGSSGASPVSLSSSPPAGEEDAVGASYCISVKKYPDGMFNKAFVLTMDNGREVVAKVPNPNAGIPHYTTASEVATMDFVSS